MTSGDWILVLTTALAWYHVGFVWLVQVVAWPLFGYVGPNEFEKYHQAWWKGIRYVLFVPSGLAFAGGVLLLFVRPASVPEWLIVVGLSLYVLTYVLTAVWYGPQQAKLHDTKSPQFRLINETHWIRTALVSAYGLSMLAGVVVRIASG
jgi:hypothetical protein